jgi:hypothetical protein
MATADKLKKVAEFMQKENIGFSIFGNTRPGSYSLSGTPTLSPDSKEVLHVDIYPEQHGMYLPFKSIDEIYELLANDPATRITLW